MTVLETEKSAVPSVQASMDRYITPEYLAHLPTSPESKNEKSPLQLLAQTCSQIGVDNGPSKILSGSDKLKANEEKSKKVLDSFSVVTGAGAGDAADKVSFKPYRNSEAGERAASARLVSSASPVSVASASPVSASSDVKTKDNKADPPHKSAVSGAGQKALSSPSPIIQSGMDLLTSAPKLATLPPSTAYDPANPAFRPPGLDAAAGFMTAAAGGSAVSAGAAHAAALKDSMDPMASYNAYLARLSMTASGLPPGYMELLESYRMYSAAAAAAGAGMRLPGPGLGSPESHLAAYSQLLAGSPAPRYPAHPGPSVSSVAGLASSRYSPYPKPGYPGPAPLPPSIPGLPGQLPPHLSSLGAMGASSQQMALYSLLGGRL